ncbi:hypothetical protein DL98DRAFT_315560 [Cadophora sp. DSE1049]|nr:hypothetical protein DL98DRAFT_315560 [Cadophora sp. DSE1049]
MPLDGGSPIVVPAYANPRNHGSTAPQASYSGWLPRGGGDDYSVSTRVHLRGGNKDENTCLSPNRRRRQSSSTSTESMGPHSNEGDAPSLSSPSATEDHIRNPHLWRDSEGALSKNNPSTTPTQSNQSLSANEDHAVNRQHLNSPYDLAMEMSTCSDLHAHSSAIAPSK